jgi:iron complex transport system substrate-binding protein
LLSLALAGCKRKTASGPLRVVSLSPSTTEAMFAIGAGSLLVGRSQQCDFPPEASNLPNVGAYADPDLERMLALAPTLIIGEQGPAGPALEEKLRARGIATFFPPTRSVADIGLMLLALGDRVGHTEGAKRAKAAIDADVARVRAWAAKQDRLRVVMVFDARPLFVAGPGGFPDELIHLAGATNAVRGGGAYPTIDIERLLALDPDAIIDATDDRPGNSRLAEGEGWTSLRAVKGGKLRKLGSAAALRPGPRIGAGLLAVARAIHGVAPDAGAE